MNLTIFWFFETRATEKSATVLSKISKKLAGNLNFLKFQIFQNNFLYYILENELQRAKWRVIVRKYQGKRIFEIKQDMAEIWLSEYSSTLTSFESKRK